MEDKGVWCCLKEDTCACACVRRCVLICARACFLVHRAHWSQKNTAHSSLVRLLHDAHHAICALHTLHAARTLHTVFVLYIAGAWSELETVRNCTEQIAWFLHKAHRAICALHTLDAARTLHTDLNCWCRKETRPLCLAHMMVLVHSLWGVTSCFAALVLCYPVW